MDSSNQVPAIRPQQFETDSIGSMKSSINLFRGDVNFTKSLVALPGKPGDDTLAVSLNIQCQSNVHLDATTWNRDAPTGALGLGWVLPLERIVATNNGAVTPQSTSFLLDTGGTTNALIPTTDTWVRAVLDGSLVSELQGGTITPALVTAFAANGLALGQGTVSQSGGGGTTWEISDQDFERVYSVRSDGTSLTVLDGGLPFQLQRYEFWRIVYYPGFEKWEITTDKGERRVYGGGLGKTSDRGFATSAGNSIQWGVKWGGASGSWLGPSSVTQGQAQYPVAWNLSSRWDRWGDKVLYAYNEFPRDADGLLEGVERRVGAGGLPYTRAVHLTSIVDVFGRTIRLDYGYKNFTAGLQEYSDPHLVLTPASLQEMPPENLSTPTAFQDCYETRYLSAVTVSSPTQDTLYTLGFSYALQNLSTTPAAQQPGLVKRYLTAITESNPSCDSLPGFQFAYYTDEKDGPNLGALRAITYPQGGRGEYTYQQVELPVCDRSYQVDSPGILGANATPLIWLGSDFAVNIWLSEDGSAATLDIYTWIGRWQRWSPPSSTLYNDPGATIDPSTLQVTVNDDTVGVAFTVGGTQSLVFLYNRTSSRPDVWAPLDYQGSDHLTFTTDDISLAGGASFLLLTVFDDSAETWTLYRYTWNWSTGWQGLGSPVIDAQPQPLFVLAANEYYLTATATQDGTQLALFAVDALGGWTAGGLLKLGTNLQYNDGEAMVWTSRASTVAMTFAEGGPGTSYTLALARWDASYQFTDSFDTTGLQPEPIDAGGSWPPVPVFGSDGFVAARQYVFRFDGTTWQQQSFESYPFTSGWLAFACGEDVVLQVTNDGSQVQTSLLPFDANAGAFAPMQQIPQSLLPKSDDVDTQGWPSAVGGDYVIAQNALFFRGSVTDWSSAAQGPVYPLTSTQALVQSVDSQSIVNQAPAFLATLLADAAAPENDQVQFLLLRNGNVLQPLPAALPNQSYFNPLLAPPTVNPAGQVPSNGATLVTYAANQQGFSQAPSFTLHRYAGDDLGSTVTAWPVSQLSVDDGFNAPLVTAYRYDISSAACDPDGRVVKFVRSTVLDGVVLDEAGNITQAAFGRSVYTFINGTAPGTGYSMLDGLQQQQVDFAGAFLFACAWSSELGLDPAAPLGAPVAVPSALASAFSTGNLTLSSAATLQHVQLDGVYGYWLVLDGQTSYTLDYNGDPEDARGVTVYSGQAVRGQTTVWELFTSRNSNPTLPDAQPPPLHGGYARPGSTTSTQDGVALTASLDYLPGELSAPFTGNPVQRSSSFTNGTGQLETRVDQLTYGCEVYPALLQQNLLSPVVAQWQRVGVGSASPVTSQSSATTWQGWQQRGGAGLTVQGSFQEWRWNGDPTGQDSGGFPFTGTPSTALWTASTTAKVRDDGGTVLESTDAAELLHATLYDARGQVAVAVLANASFAQGQALYAGFESYEDPIAWSLSGGAALAPGEARTGAVSVQLPGAGATLTLRALSPEPGGVQVFGAWYKTQPGFTAGAGSGWMISVQVAGQPVGMPLSLPFTDTGGAWVYQQARVDLPGLVGSAARQVSVQVTATNAASQGVWVDDARFIPLTSTFSATVYDGVFRLPIAQLSAGFHITRTVRDAFMRDIGRTTPSGAPLSLSLSYQSRQAPGDTFVAAAPNATLDVKAFSDGSFANLDDGQSWQAAWTSSRAGAFQAQDGVLVHAEAVSDTLTVADGSADGDFLLHAELLPLEPGEPLSFGDDFSVVLGTDATFTWRASTGQWTLTTSGSVSPLGQVSHSPRGVVLLRLGGTLALYVEGQLLFSTPTSSTAVPALVTGANAFALSNLLVMAAPSVQVTFSDATGTAVQRQALTADAYLAHQTVKDAGGRVSITTRTIPGSSGTGASLPVLAYRPGLVDLEDFLDGLDTSGVMTGDVALYYPEDGGYPYTRRRLEPSTLARVLELGAPGKDNAIVNAAGTSPTERPTVQFSYGIAGAVPGLSLPAGSFSAEVRTSQLKVATTTLRDATRGTIARFTVNGSSLALQTTARVQGNGQSVTTVVAPNSFVSGTLQAVSRTSNALGQLLSEQSPDTGLTSYLHDSGGRVRFIQDAAAAASGLLVYLTYDALGRTCSRGVVSFDWNDGSEAQLRTFADDPAWPENQQQFSYTRQSTTTYDGDGSDPGCLGLQVAATAITGTGDSAVTVSETYGYDEAGLLAQRTVSLSTGGDSPSTYTLGYGYDTQGNLVHIDYPLGDSTGLSSVQYTRDGMGRITRVADQSGNVLASYGYSPEDRPTTIAIGGATATGNMTYDSLGRLVSGQLGGAAGGFSLGLSYQADCTPASLTTSLTGASVSDGDQQTFTYDDLGRLTGATSQQPERAVAIGYQQAQGPTDQNGNIQTLTVGGTPNTFAYADGTNLLDTATPGSASTVGYTYLANGALSQRQGNGQAPDLRLTYQDGSILPVSIANTTRGLTVSLAYDASGRRAWKQTSDGHSLLYVQGGTQGPLLTVDESGTAKAWVYGPTGLVGMVTGGERHGLLTDHLGSTRAVIDSSGNLVAGYAYVPQGGVIVCTEPSTGFVPFLFTGQEYDVELGLHCFGSRLYDPSLGRFLAADPRRQYPSPYLYVGDHMLMLVDPTGEMSTAGEGILDAVLAVAFVVFTVATGGAVTAAATAAAAATESTLAGLAAGGVVGAVGGAFSGAAYAGLQYNLSTPPGRWSGQGFGQAVWIGAAGGTAGGLVSGWISPMADAMEAATTAAAREALPAELEVGEEGAEASVAERKPPAEPPESPKSDFQRIVGFYKANAYSVGGSVLGSAVQNVAQTALTNVVTGKSPSSGLFQSALKGFVVGAFTGTLGSLASDSMKDMGWLVSGFKTDPVFAVVGTGTALLLPGGLISAGFIAYTGIALEPYGSHS